MKNIFLILAAVFFIFGCKKNEDAATADIEDTAQQIGDVMASVDEAGGSTGSVASLDKYKFQKTFDRLDQTTASVAENMAQFFVLPAADAVTCNASGTGYGFGTCSGSRTIVRTFNGCTIGTTTVSGDVTLTWSGTGGSGCSLGGTPASDAAITRSPNFQITGRRGATLTVAKSSSTNIGQKIAYVSGANPSMLFNFTNDGIRRKFTTTAGAIILDQTTTVSSGTPITITGNARTNRVMNGGFLTVTNNLTNIVCNYSPDHVTWNIATCNCPVQGSWTGSCTSGKSATLNITGCGTAKYTEGDATSDITFDRCGG